MLFGCLLLLLLLLSLGIIIIYYYYCYHLYGEIKILNWFNNMPTHACGPTN